MKQYGFRDIRNIALAGHGGSGKTSFAEALLFKSGSIDRLGKILDGNTTCDYDPEEVRRKTTINTTTAYLEWKDVKINIVDTPGSFDFAGGMQEGISACESVVITLSGKSGVTVGAVKAYETANEQNKAKMLVITKLDEEHADFYSVFESAKANFGPSVCPVVVPHIKDDKIDCYVNLIEMKAYTYDDKGNPTVTDMPESHHRLDGLITAISEAVAETDEELFDKYFSGEKFTEEELIRGLHSGIKHGQITPVIGCSSFSLAAIDMALKSISYLLPSPDEVKPPVATDADGNAVVIECDEKAPLAAFIFKTIADPFVGKMSFVKVLSGELDDNSEPINASTGATERIGKIVALKGKKQSDIKKITAGDIAVITKINANTTDTLCAPSRVVKVSTQEFAKPCYFRTIVAKGKGDEGKISQGIQRLLEEDLTLSYEVSTETNEQILGGLGEQHLDVAAAKLKSKFGVEIDLLAPKIAYRETIRHKVKVEGKHKKQTGGHGQYGHVWIEFEPHDGEELIFEEKVFGGSVPKNFFPAVEKGLQDSAKKGVLAGFPVVGLKATLLDGSYHPVDSSEMAFKMAASIAYREGMKKATPWILEPIGKLKVIVSDVNTGDMMGDLNKRRGRVVGMNPYKNNLTEIEADVPIAEMQDFAMAVRQMTQGMGSFTLEFDRYEMLPANLQEELISQVSDQ